MAEQFKQISLSGKTFMLYLIDPFDAIGLDVEVAQLCAPIVEAMAIAAKDVAADSAAGEELAEQVEGAAEGEEPAAGPKPAQDEMSDDEVEKLFGSITKVLKTLRPAEFSDLLKRLLETVEYIDPKSGRATAIGSSTPTQRKTIFGQNLMLMYRLMLEVARFNRFLPFALDDIGSLMGATPTSSKAAKKQAKRGMRSALSGGPPPA